MTARLRLYIKRFAHLGLVARGHSVAVGTVTRESPQRWLRTAPKTSGNARGQPEVPLHFWTNAPPTARVTERRTLGRVLVCC